MSNVTVIGAQWGDEGKGKVIDWLAYGASVVVRFQGGHNAGHTLVINGKSYKLSLLPSGVARGRLSIIGNGVVIDPEALLAEIARIESEGLQIDPEKLRIAENAPLILPIHRALDQARENARGSNKIGTTGRGIGPAYEDKVARRAIRLCDLAEEETLSRKLDELLLHHNTLLAGLGANTFKKEELLSKLKKLAPNLLPFAEPVWQRLHEICQKGERILFEGAQAVMLDVDHGTYPFVTSSNTIAATAAAGAGIGPYQIGTVLGIAKAYCTRVGAGPFPTELFDEIGQTLGEKGKEFGTITGRPRRCGWFDVTLVRQAVQVGGIQGLVLTKLDVLDHFKEIKIGIGYEIEGKFYDYLPASPQKQAQARPIYEIAEGWNTTTRGIRSWSDLPIQAIKYIRRIEELVAAPVSLLSTGPDREDTIVLKDPFTN